MYITLCTVHVHMYCNKGTKMSTEYKKTGDKLLIHCHYHRQIVEL